VGLSEGEAQRQDIIVRVAKLPMSSVLRTEATEETQGFMKVVVSGDDDRILGFTMIGSQADRRLNEKGVRHVQLEEQTNKAWALFH
jgi:pyruvate/2-oxoglutarate dehydrogenase complex dihydrolipoamide dehydrogenase (E3) component